MNKVNHYVAWQEFHGDRSARYQGFAETQEEFELMCKEKNFDLSEVDEIECIKEDARDAGGRPCEKKATEY